MAFAAATMMESKDIALSLIICTRDRAFILPECLEALVQQTASAGLFEVLIVDNASADETPAIAEAFCGAHTHFRYVREERVGLSHARNRGAAETRGVWLAYLDDDARADPDFVERALWVIGHYPFDCFGGTYRAWFRYGRPRWLPAGFGEKARLLETVGLLEEGFLSGGVFLVKKEVLEAVGGFDPGLGMSRQIGYGEEDELQMRLRRHGYLIGFDPALQIGHCVLPEKLRVGWHLRSAFAHGRDNERIRRRYTGRWLAGAFLASLAGLFLKRGPLAFYRLLFARDYYWQNALLDMLKPLAIFLGIGVALWQRAGKKGAATGIKQTNA